MTLQEAYQKLGGNYDAVLKRLFSDQLIYKYLGMFARDDTYARLAKAFELGEKRRADGRDEEAAEAYREAFEHVHELKGVSLNLGLDHLAASSGALCESLRFGFTEEAPALYQETSERYGDAVRIICEVLK